MYKQLTIFDLYPEAMPVPKMWDCMKTCANCGTYMDYFPIRSDGKRCLYGIHMDGTTGNDMRYDISATGRVTFYCKYYRRK